MYSWLMFGFAAVGALGLAWTFRTSRDTRDPMPALVAAVLVILVAEALLVGVGRWLGPGPVLVGLSRVQLVLSGLILPLLLMLAALAAHRAGLRVALRPGFLAVATAAAVMLALVELATTLPPPSVYPACWQDTLYYLPSVPVAQACAAGQEGIELGRSLSFVGLLVQPVLVLAGIVIWAKRNWPWLFWGQVGAFLLAVPVVQMGPLAGLLANALALGALAGTAVHFRRHPPQQRAVRVSAGGLGTGRWRTDSARP